MNKRIGVITDDFYPIKGGIGRHINDIYSKFNQKEILYFSPSKNSIKNHVQLISRLSAYFKNIGLSIWLQFNIKTLIKRYHLTKINIHCGPGGLFLLRKLDIPVIATCHHTYWQQSHYIASQFWRRIFIPFEKRTYNLVNKIICVSEDSKNILIHKYNINKSKIIVIPNGVDVTKFHPLKNIKKISKSILYVGRIDKRKGVDFLIETMPLIVSEIPDVKLFIGGNGAFLEQLKYYVKKNNLEKNVIFLGFVPDEKLNYWYNRVNCVIVPSVFEGFGITVIESLAAGTQVVGTDVDGIRTILPKSDLVGYGNNIDLQHKIVKILKEKNPIKRISNKYLIRNVAIQTMKCYKDVY